MNKKFATSIIFFASLTALSSGALASGPFMSKVDSVHKQIFLQKLNDVLPPYIKATDNVLRDIGKLPGVKSSTRLEKIPNELFVTQAKKLDGTGVFSDVAFSEGRIEESVAWLKRSSVGLKQLSKLVKESLAGQNVDAELDRHLTEGRLWTSKDGSEMEVRASLNDVSRFYCNLDVRVYKNTGMEKVETEASESCD